MTIKNERIDDADLERLDIRRVPTDIFLWRGYRYTNARDAIAAATRAEPS